MAKKKTNHLDPSHHVLDRIAKVIKIRSKADPQHSYVARKLARGRLKCAEKFGEEAVETIIAAVGQDKRELIDESADVLFHLLVLWQVCGIKPKEVWQELEAREGISGLDEKAARTSGK